MSMKKETREKITEAAYRIADTHGLHAMTRARIAAHAGVSDGHVNNAYGSMTGLESQVVALALERGSVRIVLAAVSDRHPATRGMTSADLMAFIAQHGKAKAS